MNLNVSVFALGFLSTVLGFFWCRLAGVLVLAFFSFFAVVFYFHSAYYGKGIFLHKLESVYKTYGTASTPTSSGSVVWSFMYIWHFVWLLYSLFSLLFFHHYIPLVPEKVLLPFILACLLHICCLRTFDRHSLTLTMVLMLFLALDWYWMTHKAQRYLSTRIRRDQFSYAYVLLFRVLLINSGAFSMTWAFLNALWLLEMSLAFANWAFLKLKVVNHLGSWLLLAFLLLLVGHDRSQRLGTFYTISPYFALAWYAWNVCYKKDSNEKEGNHVTRFHLFIFIVNALVIGLKFLAIIIGPKRAWNFLFF